MQIAEEKLVDCVDTVMKVEKILDYLSNNSADVGLSFILEECRSLLAETIRDMGGNQHEHP